MQFTSLLRRMLGWCSLLLQGSGALQGALLGLFHIAVAQASSRICYFTRVKYEKCSLKHAG